MITQPKDTTREAEKIQVMLLRQARISKKFSLMISLTSFVVAQSRKAIQQANNGLAKKELDLLFVKYNYGVEIEKKVRRLLELQNE